MFKLQITSVEPSGTYTSYRPMDTYQMARAEAERLIREGFARVLIMERNRAGKWHISFDSSLGY